MWPMTPAAEPMVCRLPAGEGWNSEPSVPRKRDIDFRAQWKNVLSICVIPTTVIAEPSRSAINGATFMRVAFSG
jgi:hypothetical protein